MNTTAATAVVTPFTQNNNKQPKQTAKEVIAANVQALIEQLEQGHSEALTAYLTSMGRFHNYSSAGKSHASLATVRAQR
jgi:hypothetical protein